MNRQRLEFATLGFLNEMRKQFTKMHPNDPCPILNLKDYSEADRSALMSGVQKAIQFADTTHDVAYNEWQRRRETEGA